MKIKYRTKKENRRIYYKRRKQPYIKTLTVFFKGKFDIEVSKATAHRLYKELGFSYITPRPIHYKKTKKPGRSLKKSRSRN